MVRTQSSSNSNAACNVMAGSDSWGGRLGQKKVGRKKKGKSGARRIVNGGIAKVEAAEADTNSARFREFLFCSGGLRLSGCIRCKGNRHNTGSLYGGSFNPIAQWERKLSSYLFDIFFDCILSLVFFALSRALLITVVANSYASAPCPVPRVGSPNLSFRFSVTPVKQAAVLGLRILRSTVLPGAGFPRHTWCSGCRKAYRNRSNICHPCGQTPRSFGNIAVPK